MSARLIGAAYAALLLATPLDAQQTAAPAAPNAQTVQVDPDSVQQAIKEMAAALRNLVVAQEKHWSEHGTYTTDLSALGLYPAPKGSRPEFLAQVAFAGGRGWSGIAVHRRYRKSCVIYVGFANELPLVPRTERDRIQASGEGEPACERP